MDLYIMERLIELQRTEQELRLAQARVLREAGVAGGIAVRRGLAVALIALATRLAPSTTALDERVAAIIGLRVTTR